MKYIQIIIVAFLLLIQTNAYACPACEEQQPTITRGLTHGAGPTGNWDCVIIILMAVVTIITLIYSIKYLIKPGEKEKSHIKQSILTH